MSRKLRIGLVGLLFGFLVFSSAGTARADEYGALAAGISGERVGVGYATNFPTQGDADAQAVRQCQERTNNCRVVSQFRNGGCGFITTAVTNGTCYGFGATPEIALAECRSRGCGACQTPIGGCTR